jgi:hypothetical protein
MVRVWWGCEARCSPKTQRSEGGASQTWRGEAAAMRTMAGGSVVACDLAGAIAARLGCRGGQQALTGRASAGATSAHRESPPREPSLGQPRCRCRWPSPGSASIGRSGGLCRVVAAGPRRDSPRASLAASPDPPPWGGQGLLPRGCSWPLPRSAQALADSLPGIRLRRHHHTGEYRRIREKGDREMGCG